MIRRWVVLTGIESAPIDVVEVNPHLLAQASLRTAHPASPSSQCSRQECCGNRKAFWAYQGCDEDAEQDDLL